MGKLIFITGGARSGKSTFAQKMAGEHADVACIYTALPLDDEMIDRIGRHKGDRPSHWKTFEAYRDIGRVIMGEPHEFFILDCITVMINNLMHEMDIDWDDPSIPDIAEAEALVLSEVDSIIAAVCAVDSIACVVTNETGFGIVPATPMGRAFRDIAGRANQKLAQYSDEAYLLLSGLPMKLK